MNVHMFCKFRLKVGSSENSVIYRTKVGVFSYGVLFLSGMRNWKHEVG